MIQEKSLMMCYSIFILWIFKQSIGGASEDPEQILTGVQHEVLHLNLSPRPQQTHSRDQTRQRRDDYLASFNQSR